MSVAVPSSTRPVPGAPRVPLLLLGTAIWLASESLFFGALLGALFTLRARATGPFPPAGAELDTVQTGLATLVLIASSGTVHLAVARLRAGDRAGFRRFELVTAALGAVFLAAQAVEWSRLDFGVSDHAFGSAFYLTTGFHGLHLLGGIVALALLAGRSTRPAFGPAHLPGAEMVSLYWHFVDVVWLAVFASFYLVA